MRLNLNINKSEVNAFTKTVAQIIVLGERMYCGVEFGGGGGGGGECVDDKFQVLASAPDRGLHIPSSSSSSPLSAFGDHGILVFWFKT